METSNVPQEAWDCCTIVLEILVTKIVHKLQVIFASDFFFWKLLQLYINSMGKMNLYT